MSAFFALLTVLVLIAAALGAVTLVLRGKAAALEALIARHAIGAGAAVMGTATLGSLYYSEIVGFVPCELCWFQRVFAYPLALVLGLSLLHHLWQSRASAALPPTGVWSHALPMAALGLGIAVWHVALQRVPALDTGVCDAAVPCSGIYVEQLGFVTLPVMAASAFAFVLLWGAVALVHRKRDHAPPARDPSSQDVNL